MTVMHQHYDAATEGQSCQERQSVLAVDHHIWPDATQRTEAESRGNHRQARPDIDAVVATAAADADAVAHLPSRGAGIAGGTQRDVDSRLGKQRTDALQVGLAAPALGVAGVAPAQQQHRADGGGHPASLYLAR